MAVLAGKCQIFQQLGLVALVFTHKQEMIGAVVSPRTEQLCSSQLVPAGSGLACHIGLICFDWINLKFGCTIPSFQVCKIMCPEYSLESTLAEDLIRSLTSNKNMHPHEWLQGQPNSLNTSTQTITCTIHQACVVLVPQVKKLTISQLFWMRSLCTAQLLSTVLPSLIFNTSRQHKAASNIFNTLEIEWICSHTSMQRWMIALSLEQVFHHKASSSRYGILSASKPCLWLWKRNSESGMHCTPLSMPQD